MSQHPTPLHVISTVIQRTGLALFILYVVQVIIGNVIHSFKPRSALRRRPPQNYFHAVLGIAIIATAFYQVRTGYKEEWPEFTGRDPLPKAADIVYYIWVVVSHLTIWTLVMLIEHRFFSFSDSSFLFCTLPAWRYFPNSSNRKPPQGPKRPTMR